jgi:hypothetical protein
MQAGTRFASLLYQSDRVNRNMATIPVQSEPDVGFHSLLLPPVLLRELEQALRTIRYGSVELVIHEGRVVQLERREKVRVDVDVTRRK